jgi:sterol 3beta-glucosyltransferase
LFSIVLITVLQHGIEYGYVGGDPAELMRICVENGTFTLSFMKEGLLKVLITL